MHDVGVHCRLRKKNLCSTRKSCTRQEQENVTKSSPIKATWWLASDSSASSPGIGSPHSAVGRGMKSNRTPAAMGTHNNEKLLTFTMFQIHKFTLTLSIHEIHYKLFLNFFCIRPIRQLTGNRYQNTLKKKETCLVKKGIIIWLLSFLLKLYLKITFAPLLLGRRKLSPVM